MLNLTPLSMVLLLLVIGLAAGVLSGLFGVGGGVIIVPALIYFARYPVQTAIGTSLGALLLPVGLLGAWTFHRAGHLEVRASLWIALGLAIGVLGGAQLAQLLSDTQLRRAFAVFLAMVSVKLWLG